MEDITKLLVDGLMFIISWHPIPEGLLVIWERERKAKEEAEKRKSKKR